MLYRGPIGGGAASGAVGALIASHCAQGQYLKTRVKNTNPRSLLQSPPRNALAQLVAQWNSALTADQRAAWTTYAANVTWLNRLGDTVHLSGQMEFVRSNAPRIQGDQLYGDPFDFPLMRIILDAPTTFDRGDPGPTPTIGLIPGNNYLTMTYDNTASWVTDDPLNCMLVYVNIPKNSGVNFFRRRSRLAGIIHASDATGSFNFLNQWLPAVAYQQKWTAWWAIARQDGRLTRYAPVTPFDTGPPPAVITDATWTRGGGLDLIGLLVTFDHPVSLGDIDTSDITFTLLDSSTTNPDVNTEQIAPTQILFTAAATTAGPDGYAFGSANLPLIAPASSADAPYTSTGVFDTGDSSKSVKIDTNWDTSAATSPPFIAANMELFVSGVWRAATTATPSGNQVIFTSALWPTNPAGTLWRTPTFPALYAGPFSGTVG